MKVVKKVENAYGIMNGVKTKLDGHIISINDYPNELVQKQIKLNHLASQFRDLANKLESHTNFNQDLKSFLTKHSPLTKKDACYHKAKAKYDVFPSAYASGYIAKCRKRGGKMK